MFYPARWKKITVDQSKVLQNRLFRFFWATRYNWGQGHKLPPPPPTWSFKKQFITLLSYKLCWRWDPPHPRPSHWLWNSNEIHKVHDHYLWEKKLFCYWVWWTVWVVWKYSFYDQLLFSWDSRKEKYVAEFRQPSLFFTPVHRAVPQDQGQDSPTMRPSS